MKVQLTLDIDGTRYGMTIDKVSDDADGLHIDFDKIIYDTINYHVAASKGLVLSPGGGFIPPSGHSTHGAGAIPRVVSDGPGYFPEPRRG